MIENQGTRAQKIVTIYDDVYDLPDCRAYYRAMDHAGFRTAHFAAAAFRDALQAVKKERGLDRLRVVDFASGYGIAAQLMRFDIALDDGLPLLVLSFHSPSLAPGFTPYAKDAAAVEALYDWFTQIYAYLNQRGVRSATIPQILKAAHGG